MIKSKYKRIKCLRHQRYRERKEFFRKHGRKSIVLLTVKNRKNKKNVKIYYDVTKKNYTSYFT